MELQLAHSSVKEYLTSRSELEFGGAFIEHTARAVIAEICLRYLLRTRGFATKQSTTRLVSLADFAVRYWAPHAAKCNEPQPIYKLATVLFANQVRFQRYCQLYHTYLAPNSPLGLCIMVRLKAMCSISSRTRRQCRHRGRELWKCPPGSIIKKGHLDIVKILLENNADINAQGGSYGSALQAASAAAISIL